MAFEIRPITVEPGDTLSSIARREYGADADKKKLWKHIFIANAAAIANQPQVQELPEKIGPNFIWPGTLLQIVHADFDDDAKPSAL